MQYSDVCIPWSCLRDHSLYSRVRKFGTIDRKYNFHDSFPSCFFILVEPSGRLRDVAHTLKCCRTNRWEPYAG